MNKEKKKLCDCIDGDIIAEDVFNHLGIALVIKNTILNKYISDKLLDLGIKEIYIYQKDNNPYDDMIYDSDDKVEYSYYQSFLNLKQLINELTINHSIEYKLLTDISNEIFHCLHNVSSIIRCLSEIKNTDEYTYYHSLNVAFYAMLLAKWLNFSDEETKDVIKAGLLHDIGKTQISNEILNKKGKLNEDEFEIIKKHCIYGYETIKNITGLKAEIVDAVRHHHERVDGSGYPDHLRGKELGQFSKIIAIVDVYDAMTQNRVYKDKVTPFDSFKMFLTIGISNYDSKILFTFLNNLSAYYAGTKVVLSDGQIGEIAYVPPQDIAYPIIAIDSKYIDLSRERELKILRLEL